MSNAAFALLSVVFAGAVLLHTQELDESQNQSLTLLLREKRGMTTCTLI
jgi:hypothetical protein